MRLSTKPIIAISLVVGISYLPVRSAEADQVAFAVDNTENLFSVDLTTATATPIGFTGQFLQGLAVSPTGGLFGTDYLGNLFSVSPTTGAATFIGSTGLGNPTTGFGGDIEGLGFRGTTLIGTNFSPLGGPTTVFAINTSTAAVTPVTTFQQGPARAMAVLSPTTVDVSSDSPVAESLVQVNLLTGIPTVLGQLPSNPPNGAAVSGTDLISALSFGTDGNLYALDALGNDFLISSNGAGTLIGNTGGQDWLDSTMASFAFAPTATFASITADPPGDPVPEPSSMALLLMAAVGLLGAHTWRRSGRSAGS
jgi:hypothetical protein